MGVFEDLHRDRITGSLAMYDRVIFKGYLSGLFGGERVRTFLWSQGVPLTEFTTYARATTERIADNARKLVTDAGRPVISYNHMKTLTGRTARTRWPRTSPSTTVSPRGSSV